MAIVSSAVEMGDEWALSAWCADKRVPFWDPDQSHGQWHSRFCPACAAHVIYSSHLLLQMKQERLIEFELETIGFQQLEAH